MQIKPTLKEFTLQRYGGHVDGKPLLVRIGAVPLETKPDEVPTAVKERLTPLELRELEARLHEQQEILTQALVDKITVDLTALAGSDLDVLNQDAAAKLLDAAAKVSLAVRRIQRLRSTPVSAATESS